MKRRNLFIFGMFLMPVYMYAQDTTYYDLNDDKTKSLKLAQYYKVIIPDSVHADRSIEREYSIAGKLKLEKKLLEVRDEKGDKKPVKKLDGKYRTWYENGQLHKDIDYTNGNFEGQLLTYWENGELKRKDLYKGNKLIEGICYDSLGSKVEYIPYEQMPRFRGGDQELFKYLSQHVRYPVSAQKNGIQGRVITQFVVDKEGNIVDLKVLRSVAPDLDAEALRVIRLMPAWEPGKQEGKEVRVKYTLPVNFRLQ